MDRRRRQRREGDPLFKVPVDGGAPVRLVDGVDAVISNPVWSPDGRFILYSEGKGTATVRLQGITPDKRPFPCRRSGSRHGRPIPISAGRKVWS